ncbi:MAG: hypothetical protein K2Q14_01775 [Gammaproteobacteria bacterium]|nr:hypothetical protein [Gammaproteobacteria bacterium]
MIPELNSILIIDSIRDLSELEIDKLLATGICYFKKFDKDEIDVVIHKFKATALTFFDSPSINKSMTPQYEDRRKRANPEQAERLSFPIAQPPDCLSKQQIDIQMLTDKLNKVVVKPLLEAIFNHVKKPELLNNIIDDEGTYLSIVNYPSLNENHEKSTLGLQKHKDFGIVTVLCVTEPGLKILTKSEGEKVWVDIKPLEDYYVIVLAKVLELVLGKEKCTAAPHKVELSNTKRMTVGFFFNPPAADPITNAFTGEQYFENFNPSYVNSRLVKHQ